MGTLRDVAVIFIALLDLVLLLVLIVAAYFLLRGLVWARRNAVSLLGIARETADRIDAKTDAGAEKTAQLLIRTSATASAAKTFLRMLVGGRTRV